MAQVRERAATAITHAPIQRIHPTATEHRARAMTAKSGHADRFKT
jgi:hypothetical protein